MKTSVIVLALILAILLFILLGLLLLDQLSPQAQAPEILPTEPQPSATEPAPTAPPPTQAPVIEPTQPTAEPTQPAADMPAFTPAYTDSSNPENWKIEWNIIENDAYVTSYHRQTPIVFEDSDYYALPGVAAFRGSNYRTDASYGTADISKGEITQLWKMKVGFLDSADWIGCGWTGQPLVAQWDPQTRAHMNLYEDKKAKEDLVEAIYAKMDGYIHFIDMEDGGFTRDPIFLGRVFKGSGMLDPRGYPILYVGAGLTRGSKVQSIFAVNLLDGSILYEMKGHHSLAPRAWYAFDSGPLIDAETDTLIWGCESGMLYTIKLNTYYDKENGFLTMSPDAPVMTTYATNYTRKGRYAGYEASITAVDQYLYLADNSGMLMCMNVNTMELVWAQDILDDINATPLFDWGDDGRGYLYIAPSADYSDGNLPLCKIDAQTGEILWTHYMPCVKDAVAPGGMLASPLLGKDGTTMEDMVIFSMGRSPNAWDGQVVAIHKDTCQILWQKSLDSYIWSSPIALYTDDGRGYIFQVSASGMCYLLDGQTGEVVDTHKIGRTVEASPVAFGNKILLGTRAAVYLYEVT